MATGIFLLLTLLVLVEPVVRASEVYSFESLTLNTAIDRQDNWRVEPNLGQGVIALDASGNNTKVARHLKTIVFDQPAFLTRTNDVNFNFLPFTGSETNAVIQFEATGEYVAMFALGRDLNSDGLLTSAEGEIGPAFGVFDRKFRLQEANLGTAYEDGFNEGGGDANSGNDWYRIQLRLNFTALSGEGSGTLYFMNLTDGDTSFHTVSGLRNRPMGLNRLSPEARPAQWNSQWLQLLSNGNNVPSVDNLVPNRNGILITEVVPVGTDLVLHWRGGTGPYQVQRQTTLDAESWENVDGTTTLLTATVATGGNSGFFRIVQP